MRTKRYLAATAAAAAALACTAGAGAGSASSDLSITKTDSPDPVQVGGKLTYSVTIANAGPDQASNVSMQDTLPAGVTFQSATPPSGSANCSYAAPVVECDFDIVSAKTKKTIQIVVTPTVTGTITNTATVSSSTGDPNMSDNSASETTTVGGPVTTSADLSLVKSDSPDPVAPGVNLTYTLAVANAGPDAAGNVIVSDPLPSDATFVAAHATQGGCSNGPNVSCNLGSLASGGSATATIVVRPTAEGTLTNTATAASDASDPNGSNNVATAETTVRNCTIFGTAGDDTLTGTPGNDVVCGLGGNDTISGGGGDDTIDGGPGTDTVTFAGAPAGVSVDLGAGTASGWGSDRLAGIENVVGSSHSDVLVGDAGRNVLNGGLGDDSLAGLAGDDTLVGAGGSDVASFARSPQGVTVDLFTGQATGDGSDTLNGVENVTGSPFADAIRGTALPNLLLGGGGNDVLVGRSGADTLSGDAGDDRLFGGPGSNVLVGGAGVDRCVQAPGSGPVFSCESGGGATAAIVLSKTNVFSEPGESRAYAARISPKAKALVVLVTWSDPRDRFTVSLTLLRGGHVVARSLQIAGKLRPGKLRPGKLRPGKLRITRRRGSTYTTATILSPPKGGTLKVALKAKALPAPASVATSVSLGKG